MYYKLMHIFEMMIYKITPSLNLNYTLKSLDIANMNYQSRFLKSLKKTRENILNL